tara:strand:+ start:86 stop:274 length:189 start_codon:yes stop_codon:yes gene_type:complete
LLAVELVVEIKAVAAAAEDTEHHLVMLVLQLFVMKEVVIQSPLVLEELVMVLVMVIMEIIQY